MAADIDKNKVYSFKVRLSVLRLLTEKLKLWWPSYIKVLI
jgi:hypothetical protein